jgi:hypothetical protein
MFYLEFMARLHERLAPRTYLEIGVASGHSLSLSRCRSVGIDPAYQVDQPLVAPVSLFRSTSDEYFAALSASGETPFDAAPIDLAFIDGLHHFEQALRDFVAIEGHAAPTSVVAFDDVLPRDADEAARMPRAQAWAGDVFRIRAALRSERPDLHLVLVDTEPTGTLLVAGLDPASETLAERLEDIVREHVAPDPQHVPAEILRREGAIAPGAALELELWHELRAAREK